MGVRRGCEGCRDGKGLDFDFTMAFQPIVDLQSRAIWGYEALVRGTSGESAAGVLARVTDQNRYAFDQACRVKAIETAGSLFGGRPYRLSINFLPNAVYEPAACIRATLEAADRVGFAHDQLMFEFTENERLADVGKLKYIVEEYRRFGFTTALDDFGSGYAGLGLLASFLPDLVKIDMDLIRNIDSDHTRQVIVASIVSLGRDLGFKVLAEGVERIEEVFLLRASGISLMQGYHFARPMIGILPPLEFAPFGAVHDKAAA